MTLTFVEPAPAGHWNLLLYGAPGIGKSTGACSAPGPILYLNAEGPNAVRFARGLFGDAKIREFPIISKAALDKAFLYLRSGEGGEQTVVVDSLGEVYAVLLNELAGGGKPSLPNHGDATSALERFCKALRDLPVNVVLLAHELVVEDKSDGGGFERLPVTGTSNPMLGVKLMAMVDVVGYLGRVDPVEENAAPRYVAQLVSAKGRRGKDRSGALGPSRNVDLAEWFQTMAAPAAETNPTEVAA